MKMRGAIIPRRVSQVWSGALCVFLLLFSILIIYGVTAAWYWLPSQCYGNVGIQLGFSAPGLSWSCYFSDHVNVDKQNELDFLPCSGTLSDMKCSDAVIALYNEQLNAFYKLHNVNQMGDNVTNPLNLTQTEVTTPSIVSMVLTLLALIVGAVSFYTLHILKCCKLTMWKVFGAIVAVVNSLLCLAASGSSFHAVKTGVALLTKIRDSPMTTYQERFGRDPYVASGPALVVHGAHGGLMLCCCFGCAIYGLLVILTRKEKAINGSLQKQKNMSVKEANSQLKTACDIGGDPSSKRNDLRQTSDKNGVRSNQSTKHSQKDAALKRDIKKNSHQKNSSLKRDVEKNKSEKDGSIKGSSEKNNNRKHGSIKGSSEKNNSRKDSSLKSSTDRKDRSLSAKKPVENHKRSKRSNNSGSGKSGANRSKSVSSGAKKRTNIKAQTKPSSGRGSSGKAGKSRSNRPEK